MISIPNIDDLSLHRIIGLQVPVLPYDISWVRPSEWPNISNLISPTDDKIVAVYKVPTTTTTLDGVPIALLCTTSTGTYTVNWGDGTSNTYASNVKAEKLYDPTNVTLTSTSYGYKCGIVTITANTGVLLTTNFAQTYTGYPTFTRLGHGWLDIDMRCPSMTSMSGVAGVTQLKQFRLRKSVITSFVSFFSACVSLESIVELDTAAATNMNLMFNQCYSLQNVPTFTTNSVTNFAKIFQGCTALKTVPLFNTANATAADGMFLLCTGLLEAPLFNFSSVTNVLGLSDMFSGCTALKTVPLFNTTPVKSMANMFQGCSSLLEVPLLNTGACTTLASMFVGCSSLKTVPLFNTSVATNVSSMFSGCSSLGSVPLFNLAVASNTSSIFMNCTNLISIPAINFSATTTFTTPFIGLSSMQSCKITLLPALSVSFANAWLLGSNALNDIYDALPTITTPVRTITVTGCRGSATSNQSIATGKGWTLVP